MKTSAKNPSKVPPRSKSLTPRSTAICEEAFHLLRRAPASCLFYYYLGSVPFWLGFLYFWADMSRDPFAAARVVEASLGMALLYLFMKCMQSLAMNDLRSQIGSGSREPIPIRSVPAFVARQAFVHGTSCVVLPVAALITLPFGFALAYYQNATVLGAAIGVDNLRGLHIRAARQAMLWPGQSHQLLFMLSLFSLVVFLNLSALILALPYLLRMMTGVESVMTISGLAVVNSTFLLSVVALTHLLVDPVVKAAFLLRCFYGESLDSGEDLRVELASISRSKREGIPAMVQAAILTAFLMPGVALAQSPAVAIGTPAYMSAVSSAELDKALSEVMDRREFRWRVPRDTVAVPDDDGWLSTFFKKVGDTTAQVVKALRTKVRNGIEWLWKRFFGGPSRTPTAGSSGGGLGWLTSLQGITFLVLAVIVSGLGVWLFRVLQDRRRGVKADAVATAVVIPDVSKEDVTADQLPEDGWIALARELAEKGDLRLALRALYLANLSALARRGVLSIARFKSNLDYERELRRRAHAQPDIISAFVQNVAMFDRSWYGAHEVTPDVITRFSANLQALQAGGDNA